MKKLSLNQMVDIEGGYTAGCVMLGIGIFFLVIMTGGLIMLAFPVSLAAGAVISLAGLSVGLPLAVTGGLTC
jgi:hypothetical protein